MQTRRIGVINDIHLPIHDPKALNLALDVFQDVGITDLVINGDALDFYLVNSHGPKHPDIQFLLEDEFKAGNDFLDELQDRFSKSNIFFNSGNHCNRLDRFIINKCPQFWNVVSVKGMLNLEGRGIPYHEYNRPWNVKGTDLFIQHSPPSYGENGARTSLLKKFGGSWIFGCTHRMQQSHIRRPDGSLCSAYFNGWLGSTSLTDQHRRVFEYTKGHENWQQGFAVVDVIGSQYFVHQCLIKNYQTTLDGHLYDGR